MVKVHLLVGTAFCGSLIQRYFLHLFIVPVLIHCTILGVTVERQWLSRFCVCLCVLYTCYYAMNSAEVILHLISIPVDVEYTT